MEKKTVFHASWTKEQKARVAEIYDRDPSVAPDLIEFARGVHDYGEYLGVVWKGMFIGIEKDGYAHT